MAKYKPKTCEIQAWQVKDLVVIAQNTPDKLPGPIFFAYVNDAISVGHDFLLVKVDGDRDWRIARPRDFIAWFSNSEFLAVESEEDWLADFELILD